MSVSIKIQRLHPAAVLPTVYHDGDAGFDLVLPEPLELMPGERKKVALGIAVELPEGTVGLMWDRSSKANDGLKSMGGVIDASYRGQLYCILLNTSTEPLSYPAGTAILQLVVQPVLRPALEEVDSLSDTTRGDGGFGSTER